MKNIYKYLFFLVILVLVATNAYTIYYFQSRSPSPEKQTPKEDERPSPDSKDLSGDTDSNNQEEPETKKRTGDSPEKAISSSGVASSTKESPKDQKKQEQQPSESDISEDEIIVDWREWASLQGSYNFFNEQIDLIKKLKKNNSSGYSPVENFKAYKVGEVVQGSYKGNTLFNITFPPIGMGFEEKEIFRMIKEKDNYIILTKSSSEIEEESYLYSVFTPDVQTDFTLDSQTEIANLGIFKSVDIPDSELKLSLVDKAPLRLIKEVDNFKEIFSYKGKKIYKNQDKNCFFVKANDNTYARYKLQELSFIKDKDKSENYLSTPHVLDINWKNGDKNQEEYVSKSVRPLSDKCYNYPEYISNPNQLQVIGTTSAGDKIYTLKNKDMKAGEDKKRSVFKKAYDLSIVHDEISFEEFKQDRPLIYWQDPFGDFMQFKKTKYEAAVEMAKPAIYLYPEQKTNVEVEVYPEGGMTASIPDYKNGWRVEASPNGTIYGRDSGKNYPYLFWEGKGTDHQLPRKGFVVKRKNMKSFLKEKLQKLGLIEREYREFLDFWLPKMKEKPYYFVTFISQEKINSMAPLEISPEPDTVIRVLMDFKGVEEKVEVPQPDITTPERQGFTVVEWGGVLRDH